MGIIGLFIKLTYYLMYKIFNDNDLPHFLHSKRHELFLNID